MPAKVAYNLGEIPVLGTFDLVVCGGGLAGIAASIAARRSGLHVLLVEGQGQLGGMGLGGRTNECKHWVVAGTFKELAEGTAARDIALLIPILYEI